MNDYSHLINVVPVGIISCKRERLVRVLNDRLANAASTYWQEEKSQKRFPVN